MRPRADYVTADDALAVVAAYGGDIDAAAARALAAEVHRLRAELAATEAEARAALDAAEAEAAAAETLAARLGDLLRATADALKGPPPPISQHSTHDLPAVAWGIRASCDALRDVVRTAAASVGVPTGAPEATAKRLASAVSLARRESERLRAELAAAQPALMLDAIRRGPALMCCARCAAPWPLDTSATCPACGHPEQGNADRAQLAALAGARFAASPDRDRCPTCGALDLDHAPEECARRWAEQHPGVAAGIVGNAGGK